MDNFSSQQQEFDTQQKRSLPTGRWIFDSILSLMRRSLNWLAVSFQLTKEEQQNAGVFLGHLGDE